MTLGRDDRPSPCSRPVQSAVGEGGSHPRRSFAGVFDGLIRQDFKQGPLMVTNTAQAARGPGQLARDRIHSDLAAPAADAETLVRITSRDTRRQARALRVRLGAASTQARRKYRDLQTRTADTARHAARTADRIVRATSANLCVISCNCSGRGRPTQFLNAEPAESAEEQCRLACVSATSALSALNSAPWIDLGEKLVAGISGHPTAPARPDRIRARTYARTDIARSAPRWASVCSAAGSGGEADRSTSLHRLSP